MSTNRISSVPLVHQPDEHRYLTVDEVAKRIRVSRSTVRNLINDGEIPAINVGRLIRVHRTALEQYITAKLGAYFSDNVEFLSIEDVAKKIFFGRSTAYGMVAARKIPSVKFRSLVRVASTQLDAYLNGQHTHPESIP